MLKHLRQRIVQVLQESKVVALASSGPAGLEISPCECWSEGIRLFVLIPSTSEHLVNIELNPQVAITQDHWRLVGTAKPAQNQTHFQAGERYGKKPLEVHPSRFEFMAQDSNQVVETIDIGEDDWDN